MQTRTMFPCAALGTAPLYGHLPRAQLEADYRPLTPLQFLRARTQARRATTPLRYHDVIVETCEADDALVHVYPADVLPYIWRTFWRHKEASACG